MISNTFKSMKPNFKESYSDSGKKKERFKLTKTLMQPNGKATAQLDASKNPMKWLSQHKEMPIGKKGFAF